MKYLAMWAAVFAAIVLVLGALGLIIQWIAVDPTRSWIILLILGAGLIATIAASVEYLSDRPKTPADAARDAKQAAIDAARVRDI